MTYYHSIHYNDLDDNGKMKIFLKAIYWECGQGWIPWRIGMNIRVISYIEESYKPYYTQCLQWYEDNKCSLSVVGQHT